MSSKSPEVGDEANRGCKIAVVGKDDAACLARLHSRLFAKSWPEAEFASLLSGTGCLAVALWLAEEPSELPTKCSELQKDPIGFCVLRTVAGVVEIITFGVAEEGRKRGFGKALLAEALRKAAASGCKRAFLEVAEDNQAAQGLYLGFGFAEVGRRAGYYRLSGGGKVDALVLSKQIGPAELI